MTIDTQNAETVAVPHQPQNSEPRFGASAYEKLGEPWLSAPEVFSAEQETRPELPMIVWLRGDEPYCGEFTLDADEVMEELGIRRSRLTQISGHELRVGRIRRDRYVRPIYRQTDIDAYKAWSRATATHAKSSKALETAAAKLDERTQSLAETLRDELARPMESLRQVVAATAKETLSFVTRRVSALEESLNHAVRSFNEVLWQERAEVRQGFQQQIEAQKALAAKEMLTQELLVKINQLVGFGHEEQQKLRWEMKRLQEVQAETALRQEGAMADLAAQLAELKALSSVKVQKKPSPKRRARSVWREPAAQFGKSSGRPKKTSRRRV